MVVDELVLLVEFVVDEGVLLMLWVLAAMLPALALELVLMAGLHKVVLAGHACRARLPMRLVVAATKHLGYSLSNTHTNFSHIPLSLLLSYFICY